MQALSDVLLPAKLNHLHKQHDYLAMSDELLESMGGFFSFKLAQLGTRRDGEGGISGY